MLDVGQVREKYFYLFADCFLVRGHLRTMLLDLGRKSIYFVNNSYYDVLVQLRSSTIGQVRDMLEEEAEKDDFGAFLDYLLERELGVVVEDLSVFPLFEPEWDHPSIITNAIIDVRDLAHDYQAIFSQLDELRCHFIQIRAYRALSAADITKILALTRDKHFRDVQVLTQYDPSLLSEEDALGIMKKYPLVKLTIHGAPFDKWIKNEPLKGIIDLGLGSVMYIRQAIHSCSACGIINSKSFHVPSLEAVMENITHNGCLNRKISVDEHGVIKNCPSMSRGYGHIQETALSEVVASSHFKQMWHIRKDQIAVCRDCEYRYICTDCRAYTTDGETYSKPLKCQYDPYSGQWAE